jgi:hypothetical protein
MSERIGLDLRQNLGPGSWTEEEFAWQGSDRRATGESLSCSMVETEHGSELPISPARSIHRPPCSCTHQLFHVFDPGSSISATFQSRPEDGTRAHDHIMHKGSRAAPPLHWRFGGAKPETGGPRELEECSLCVPLAKDRFPDHR